MIGRRKLQRVDELLGPLIEGRKYLVPTVRCSSESWKLPIWRASSSLSTGASCARSWR
jgi:hypothetical protein